MVLVLEVVFGVPSKIGQRHKVMKYSEQVNHGADTSQDSLSRLQHESDNGDIDFRPHPAVESASMARKQPRFAYSSIISVASDSAFAWHQAMLALWECGCRSVETNLVTFNAAWWIWWLDIPRFDVIFSQSWDM